MAWVATFAGASQAQDGTVIATVKFREDTTSAEFSRDFTFQPGDPLTKAAVKALAMPILNGLNNAETKAAQATALVGQDVSLW